MLDLLEAARSNLGQLDVRTTNEQNFVASVNSFYEESVKYDAEFNSNKERAVLNILDKYKDKLYTLLDLDWNTSLAVKDGDWIFYRASPLKEDTKLECPQCSKVYKEARVLQNHLKTVHQITQDVPKPRVTCRLPHTDNVVKTIQWDQITNHLLRVHKIPKPSKLHFFRGFTSQEGGANCSVVWRKKGEEDPVPPSQQNVEAVDAADRAGPSTSTSNTAIVRPNLEPSQTAPDPTPVIAAVAGPSKTSTESESQALEQPSQQDEDLSHLDTLQEDRLSATINMVTEKDSAMNEMLLRTGTDDINRAACSKQLFPEDENPAVVFSDISPSIDEGSKPSETVKEMEPEKSKGCVSLEQKRNESAPGGFQQNFDVVDEVWEGLEADSDIEPDDSAEFTQMRLANKKNRYKAREERSQLEEDPSSLPANQAFIQDFRLFVSKKGVSNNPDENTFKKSDGLLFRHDDCLLKFILKKRPGFMLHDLLKFDKKDEFVQLKDPQAWLDMIAGPTGNDNPSRQREMLKSHKQLRDYVARKLTEADFGADYQDLWWQDKIKKNLDQITKDLSDRGLWNKLKDLIGVEFNEKQISRDNLCPNKNANEIKANAVYFSSDQFLAREQRMNAIWKTAEESKDIGPKEYNDFLNFSRHILAFTDRCRQGVYQFSNQDFFNKKKCWFPEDFAEKEFERIPDDHVIFQEPDDKRPPDMWLIRLSGSGSQIKMKNGTAVTVNQRALDFMTKCRDLKDIVFGNLGKFINLRGPLMFNPIFKICFRFRPQESIFLQV